MAGIIEKSNNGLFENEIEFVGKYADMVRYLKEDVGLFTTFREAYILSAIIGFLEGKVATNDPGEKAKAASIFPDQLSKKKRDLRLIYRIIMLLKEEKAYTLDDYKNRAFQDDPEEHAETIRANMKIFNSYACSGLEMLYNMFQGATKIDDIVDKLYEYVHGFCTEIGLFDEAIDLPDFEPDYR